MKTKYLYILLSMVAFWLISCNENKATQYLGEWSCESKGNAVTHISVSENNNNYVVEIIGWAGGFKSEDRTTANLRQDSTLKIGNGLEESTMAFIKNDGTVIFSSAYHGNATCKPGNIEDKNRDYGVRLMNNGKAVGY